MEARLNFPLSSFCLPVGFGVFYLFEICGIKHLGRLFSRYQQTPCEVSVLQARRAFPSINLPRFGRCYYIAAAFQRIVALLFRGKCTIKLQMSWMKAL